MTSTHGPHAGSAPSGEAQATARPGPLDEFTSGSVADAGGDTAADSAADSASVGEASDQCTLAGSEHASLHDGDVGSFAVRTATGRYLIDLEHRRLLRASATHPLERGYLVRTFDVDRLWLPLRALHRCAVGDGMSATILIDGQPQPLRSSPVQWIRPSWAFWD